MFEELVKELLYSWQNADAEQVEAWTKGEAWAELQALAQCQAAQQSRTLDGAVCTCKIMSSVIGDNHAEDCALHYPPRH